MRKSGLVFVLIGFLVTGMFTLSGCNGKDSDKKTIGIVQQVEHPALDAVRESFLEKLEEEGFKDGENITVDYQNASNDKTNLKTICQKFVSKKYDMILSIATSASQSAVAETKEIPIVFSAVTDPIAAGLVSDMDNPGGNVTGASDAISAELIMELAMEITPGFKKIGALYNSGEVNSISTINDLKAYAQDKGLTVTDATVTSTADVQQAVQSLVGKVDIIFVPTDNTIASAMAVVAKTAIEAKIPVYCGSDSLVKDGGLATYGVNYNILGEEVGEMAIEILNGKKAGDIPARTMKENDIYLNRSTADAIGVTIPEDLLEKAAKIFE